MIFSPEDAETLRQLNAIQRLSGEGRLEAAVHLNDELRVEWEPHLERWRADSCYIPPREAIARLYNALLQVGDA